MESLKSILEKYQVEIPIIQRDYAQGRKSPKVNRIRESFVEALLKALRSEDVNAQLHLDFIYGKEVDSNSIAQLRANENSVQEFLNAAWNHSRLLGVEVKGEMPTVSRISETENITKIFPLDGQQRLTTLWLLHYIIYHQNNEIPDWLKRFTYKTRKSSRNFISALVGNSEKLEVITNYSSAIRNTNWFLEKWEFDPTVQGMLVTLDEIYKQCKEGSLDYQMLKDNLETIDRITFEFLPLSSLNLDNGIYVKMNARGKELSPFENFKNSLLALLKNDQQYNSVDSIAKKLDLSWHDIFWYYKESGSFNVQKQFFDFLKINLIYHYLLDTDYKKVNNNLVRTILSLERNDSNKVFIDFKTLKENGLLKKELLDETFNLLNLFSNQNIIETYESWFEKIAFRDINKVTNKNEYEYSLITISLSSKNENISFYDRSMIFAIQEFIKRNNSCDISLKSRFQKYIRICQNLIYNQVYIQDIETFSTSLKVIKELAENSGDLYNYMLSDAASSSLRNRTQFSEEVLKIALIQQGVENEELFIIAEKHSYFRGQIGFLIEKAGGENNFERCEFRRTYNSIEFLFHDRILQNENYLLERALLTYGNYWNDQNRSKWQFFEKTKRLRAKEEGWRKVFRDQRRFEKLLALSAKISLVNVEGDLQKVIDTYSKRNWRYFFIKSEEPWKKCYDRYVKISSEGGKQEKVRLLEKVLANSRQRELRTFFLYKTYNFIFEPFKKIDYLKVSDQTENPCLFLDNWWFNGKKYFLDVRFYNGEYEFRFGLRADKSTGESVDSEITQLLVEMDYELDTEIYQDNSYLKYVVTEEEVKLELTKLLSSIKSIEQSITV